VRENSVRSDKYLVKYFSEKFDAMMITGAGVSGTI
jgi:hypothetical protein